MRTSLPYTYHYYNKISDAFQGGFGRIGILKRRFRPSVANLYSIRMAAIYAQRIRVSSELRGDDRLAAHNCLMMGKATVTPRQTNAGVLFLVFLQINACPQSVSRYNEYVFVATNHRAEK
jgi:hypothetical protein